MAVHNFIIQEIIRMNEFDEVIDINSINKTQDLNELRDRYVLTEELAYIICDILGTITGKPIVSLIPGMVRKLYQRRASIITAAYGKGKSHALVFIASILASLESDALFDYILGLIPKFKTKELNEVLEMQLHSLKGKRYLIVPISLEKQLGKGIELVFLSNLEMAIKKKGILQEEEYFETDFRQAAKILDLQLAQDDFRQKWEKTAKKRQTSISAIISGIESLDDKFLDKFLEIHESIFRAKPDLKKGVIIDRIFDVARDITESSNYSGIIFLVDELTIFLESSYESGKVMKEIGGLQSIAQYINNLSDFFWFVGAQHKTLELALGQTSFKKDDLDKLRGRFNELPAITGVGFPEVARSLFRKAERFDEFAKVIKSEKLFAHHEKTVKSHYSWNITPDEIFPFHPEVIELLPNISSTFEQERSAIQFLATFYNKKRQEKAIIGNKLNLVTIESLYDWYLHNIIVLSPEVNAVLSLASYEQASNPELRKKVIKGLVTLHFLFRTGLGREGDYPVSVSRFAHLLDSPEDPISETLEEISRSTTHLYKDESRNGYLISETSLPMSEIDNAIAEAKTKVNIHDELKTRLKIPVTIETVPETITRIPRKIKYAWKTIPRLPEEVARPGTPYDVDLYMVYLMPENIGAYDYDAFKELARNWVNEDQNLICIVPKKEAAMIVQQDVIRELAGLELALKDKEISQYRDQLGGKHDNLMETFSERVYNIFLDPSNFDFIATNEKTLHSDIDTISPDDIWRTVLKDIYPNFPWKMANLAESRTSVNAILTFIQGYPKAKPNQNVKKHLRDTISQFGLIEVDGDKYNFIIPSKDLSSTYPPFAAWKLLITCVDSELRLEKIYLKLKKPPFGLNDHLIEILIAIGWKYGIFKIDCPTKPTETNKNWNNVLKNVSSSLSKDKYVIRHYWTPDPESKDLIVNLLSLLPNGDKWDFKTSRENQEVIFDLILSSTQDWLAKAIKSIQEIKEVIGFPSETQDRFNKLETRFEELAKAVEKLIVEEELETRLQILPMTLLNTETPPVETAYYPFKELCTDIAHFVEAQNYILTNFKPFFLQFDEMKRILWKDLSPSEKAEMTKVNGEIKNLSSWLSKPEKRALVTQKVQEYFEKSLRSKANIHNNLVKKSELTRKDLVNLPQFKILSELNPPLLNDQAQLAEAIADRIKHLGLGCNSQMNTSSQGKYQDILTCTKCKKNFIVLQGLEGGLETQKTELANQIRNSLSLHISTSISNLEKISQSANSNLKNQVTELLQSFEAFNPSADLSKKQQKNLIDSIKNFFEAYKEVIQTKPSQFKPKGVKSKSADSINLDKFLKEFKRAITESGRRKIPFDKFEVLIEEFLKNRKGIKYIEIS